MTTVACHSLGLPSAIEPRRSVTSNHDWLSMVSQGLLDRRADRLLVACVRTAGDRNLLEYLGAHVHSPFVGADYQGTRCAGESTSRTGLLEVFSGMLALNGLPSSTRFRVGRGYRIWVLEVWLIAKGGTLGSHMTETGLAVFVLVMFLVPVPILAWLDRPRQQSGSE